MRRNLQTFLKERPQRVERDPSKIRFERTNALNKEQNLTSANHQLAHCCKHLAERSRPPNWRLHTQPQRLLLLTAQLEAVCYILDGSDCMFIYSAMDVGRRLLVGSLLPLLSK